MILERRRREPPVEYVEDIAEVDRDHDTLDTPVEEAELEAAVAASAGRARCAHACGIYGYASARPRRCSIAEGTCKAQLHRAFARSARLESGVRT